MRLPCVHQGNLAASTSSAARENGRGVRKTGRLLALAMAAGLVSRAAAAATAAPCGSDLPPSKLQVYGVEPAEAQQLVVPGQAIRRMAEVNVPSVHLALLIDREVTGAFQIEHRLVRAEDGRTFCDVPALVRIEIGYSKTTLYLAAEAAADPCVRAVLLGHAAVHDQVNAELLTEFLRSQSDLLGRAMAALKQTPAPSAETAVEQWRAGVAAVVEDMRRSLEVQRRQVQAEADNATELGRIEGACNGELKRIGRQLGDAL